MRGNGWRDRGARDRAEGTLKGLDWFEGPEIRGNIEEGSVGWYQVKFAIAFRVMDPADLDAE